ncbi:carbon starvation protein CstA [Ureibacillus massiliensis 4400831 = CIP 108448 = CCUG 49529]|uniref:Carbon starvation protein CstA n=1 Tax=Ureibacillus massiliensis 4400831 = CIP 108448 = CCUG 49529 TaxID=1211035 RepID=A0A0A3J041_9BACL|nr:carbon starvation CstA family protein [Ureibacillus massiliensis]KGR90281.1 carbon starvation protein CstA [Ureibacillus massiliensis 4400831 = CIP 108448 = CCUG 49529]
MITFLVCIVILIVGYFTYGKFVEKVFGSKPARPTPAYVNADGVDYVPMSTPKNSMIQLLNIAGTGPVFGPIAGALYGPVAFIWIVVGCIFAGAVHDYLTGMISIRNKGAHLPELAAKFLGKFMKHVVNVFALLLLILVGTVFVTSPAMLISNLMNGQVALAIIVGVIFFYYILATLLPVDKIIGRLYPIFGAVLLISAVGIGIGLLVTGAPIPELTFQNMHPNNLPIFPLIFFTITCGALSGFHATQTPIISRTTKNENEGRKIFYGMMIAEGIIAMIWAAASMSLFGGYGGLNELITAGGPAAVVSEVSLLMMGSIGGTLAIIGVIILPITSGDTAFRAARMIIADYFKFAQSKLLSRLWIAIPLFVISYGLTKIDFNILWRYFSWANGVTAVIALWVGAMYLFLAKKNHWIATIPAAFMTSMCLVYILYEPTMGFGIPLNASYVGGAVLTAAIIAIFFISAYKQRGSSFLLDEDVSGFKVNKA